MHLSFLIVLSLRAVADARGKAFFCFVFVFLQNVDAVCIHLAYILDIFTSVARVCSPLPSTRARNVDRIKCQPDNSPSSINAGCSVKMPFTNRLEM